MSEFETIDGAGTAPAGDRSPEAGGEPLYPDELVPAAVEAVLFASDKPLSALKIARALGFDEGGSVRVQEAIEGLNGAYEREGRAFRVEQVAGGYRAMTLPEFAAAVASIRGLRETGRLSPAALETLSIVAYRQPVTRVDIEGIRGVACGEVLRTLLERRLVEITGRAEELGRPMLYGTTKQFLEVFGLASIKDLPAVEDFFASAAFAPTPEPKVAPEPGVEPEPETPLAQDAGTEDRDDR